MQYLLLRRKYQCQVFAGRPADKPRTQELITSLDPLLYDRLIRRFQTQEEREVERRQKGYAGTLEADLLRSEAKLDEAQHHPGHASYTRSDRGDIITTHTDEDEPSLNRDEARERWVDAMTLRFLGEKDVDFDYKAVDESEEYDDQQTEERERQEEWFEEEEPSSSPTQGEAKRNLQGETGIQDY